MTNMFPQEVLITKSSDIKVLLNKNNPNLIGWGDKRVSKRIYKILAAKI